VGKYQQQERGKVEQVTTEISKDILVQLTILRCMLRTFQSASRIVHRTLTTRTYLMSSDQIAKRMKSTKVSPPIRAKAKLIPGHRYPLGHFPL
jgi:hypothetical protein